MEAVYLFMIALGCSFAGSIPPGSINLSVMQLAVQGKKGGALTFALAAACIEFLYAGLAVRFQIYLTDNIEIATWFKWVSGTILILLGLFNLVKKNRASRTMDSGEKRAGFAKGVVVALMNPLAIPYWLTVTTYLQAMQWIVLSSENYLVYVTGISVGTMLLLLAVIALGTRFSAIQNNPFLLYRVPGLIFLVMGVWTFVQ
ncbi:hypothetical protein BFP72_14780 [Reichenbachiella sp. 5M10]|uniref:LysE family translocator n=1 Tax=Reichenbachiella sp. 5M10 TaxID=1889772 RepID=UPI000C15F1AB|nr:LysE family transporter [Reichenbachiella sp. 5M10]PIB36575.1 hypothetical protein BFP72_14780 [Reichenbachiella sp. 5M10]